MVFVNEKCFRKFAIIVMLSCLATYTFVYQDYLADRWMYKITKLDNAYMINLEGCRIRSLDVMNPTIEIFTHRHLPKLSCQQKSWFRPRVYNGKWTLEFNLMSETIQQKNRKFDEKTMYCSYWPMKRIPKDDHTNVAGKEVPFDLVAPYRVIMPTGVSFVRVVCRNQWNKTLHQDVHFFVQSPPENLHKLKKETKDGEPQLSVMILGLDSVSHLNFLRQMRMTRRYINDKLSYVEFWGFNKIEWSSYQNLIPLLSGMGINKFEEVCFSSSKNRMFDECPLIWKDFKKAGYNTSFAEDDTTMGLFNYMKNGFKNPPTDQYLRPILLAMDNFRIKFSNNKYVKCAGGRTYGDVMVDQIDQLTPHMQCNPFFSFYWWSQGLRADFNFPQQVDRRFVKLLYMLNVRGIMNNTFILFMSNYGIRWGGFRRTYQGMMEDSQPMLYALYPNWLKQRYPLALSNLQENSHSLITTYDLHDTLINLLDLKSLKDDTIKNKTKELWQLSGHLTPQSSSLFLRLPPWRTCNTSHIASPYCLCHKLIPVPTDNYMVKRSGRTIVKSINELLQPYPQCQQLKLKAIVNAYQTSLGQNAENLLDQDSLEFKVRLQTMPGEAFFESTTRFEGYNVMLVDEIVRMGDQNNNTFCIDDPIVEMYCYCIVR